jgi:hypothetical protein
VCGPAPRRTRTQEKRRLTRMDAATVVREGESLRPGLCVSSVPESVESSAVTSYQDATPDCVGRQRRWHN